MRIFKNTNIRFMKYRKFYFFISGLVILFSIYSLTTSGLNYGIDFAGGTQMIITFQKPISTDKMDDIRSRLNSLNLGDVVVYEYGAAKDGNTYSLVIRVEATSEEGISAKAGQDKDIDIATYITEQIYTEKDRNEKSLGKESLNSIGKTQLEAIITSGVVAPSDIPQYVMEIMSVREQDNGSLTPAEMYYRLLAETIIEHRDEADRGLYRSFNELNDINNLPQFTSTNSNQPVNLMTPELSQFFQQKFYLSSFAVIGVEMVGPSVGSDLRNAAIASIIFALIGILVYITLRFKFRFGIAAIIALIHDIIITTGIYAASGKEFTLPIVAALLTIVGYSLNDTIVVADRIRENLSKIRRESYEDVVNFSINNTLSRTVLTSVTTLFVVLCLLFLGGEVLNGFAFALTIGILVGTYSSICVVSPILVLWQTAQERYKKPVRGTAYVKRSLKTLFPDQSGQKRSAVETTKIGSSEGQDINTSSAMDKTQISRAKKKKGITGRKKKKKKR